MTRRVLILIGGHLCTDPRAQKEAEWIAQLGYEVTIVGVWYDTMLAAWDDQIRSSACYTYHPVLDMRPKHRAVRFRARLVRKLARLMSVYAKCESIYVYGYGISAIESFVTQYRPHLVIAHAEGGLALAPRFARKKIPFAIDFEDWFSEDLPIAARRGRGIRTLQKLERYAGTHAAFLSLPTKAMADAFQKRFQSQKPLVIYNSFSPTRTRPIPNLHEGPLKLVWFSQTVGRGRGLESLFSALQRIACPFQLTIIGAAAPSQITNLLERLPASLRSCITFLPLQPPWQLPTILEQQDIGLALEEPHILSTNLTCSNKLFQYLAAGCAVIATATEGQLEVWPPGDNKPGVLIPCASERALADAIEQLAGDPTALLVARHEALSLARQYDPLQTAKGPLQQAVKNIIG